LKGTAIVSFPGITAKGMIPVDDISKLTKLISDQEGFTVSRFTLVIDCDKCEMEKFEIFSDTIPSSAFINVKGGYVITFECIIAKNKKGELMSHKPALFYIKP